MNKTLDRILRGQHLAEDEAAELLLTLTDESLPPAVAGAVLAALRAKGETAEEVRGFAGAMRSVARRPAIPRGTTCADIVGTGGDDSGSLNLSTGSALLAAACGQAVVKHGNRAVSSRSGSADVLEALGFALPADGKVAAGCLDETDFTFLFAPTFHPAMRALAPVRRSLGVRTVFNMLGPLTNPAEPPYAVIGAFGPQAAELMAEALSGLPIRRAFVIHGDNGWDEATPASPYLLFDVRPGRVTRSRRDPTDCGLPRCKESDLAGGDAEHNAAGIRRVFGGERGPHRDALVLGAALALEVSGLAVDVEDGRRRADAALDGGAAERLLERITDFSAGPLAAAEGGRG
jgi:anthranilate phosphoribosyltransferase